ncbi:DUF3455 domain-containing protein [Cupriavidus pauculus]|uniref:DUF3455 domain-containing protein n=1 Tax=Cupriavidus pauculus TaxID=82633 RepID=UPI001EE28FE3|nr:DUF3455 domain-containing protein [Cupriavidus pauculus]GJG94131.1 DUF3455 domain-containing protein [Cupriavidus pauculus]
MAIPQHFYGAWLTVLGLSGVLASCATSRVAAPPDLQPADVRGTVAVLHAAGTQNYQCKRGSDGRLLWTLVAPDATLKDDLGQVVVKHYAGPTWEAPDGSKITGKVLKQLPNAQAPDSIPLLLLQATSTGGSGLLSRSRYVQRLNTQGGQALPQTCTQEGQENRMPYRADYVFLE